MSSKKTKILISVIFLFVAVFFLYIANNNSDKKDIANIDKNNIGVGEINNNIRLFVKGGYSPSDIVVKAETPYTLQMVTKSTFDCSASLIIKKLGVNKYLSPTGTFEINIPPQEKGAEIIGTCSMGMYSFKIRFE